MKAFRLVLALGFMAAVAACGDSGSSNPASSDDDDDDDGQTLFALDDGDYDFVIDAAPEDTCWAPPKTMPELPMTQVATFTTEGDTITVVISDPTMGEQTMTLTRTGNTLKGGGTGPADTGLGCVLSIVGDFEGELIADNVFDADMVLDISQESGSCGILVGATEPQVDALPCHLGLEGSGAKP